VPARNSTAVNQSAPSQMAAVGYVLRAQDDRYQQRRLSTGKKAEIVDDTVMRDVQHNGTPQTTWKDTLDKTADKEEWVGWTTACGI